MMVAGLEFTRMTLQGLTGLDAGIVELAALADNDGAGADDENFPDRGIFRHGIGVG
jgi:hypothetical protein